jgi:hypothetical protein
MTRIAARRRFIDTRLGLIVCLLAFFVLGLPAFFAFEAWYQAGSATITVQDIGDSNINSPDRSYDTVSAVGGATYVVRGARYPVLGGQNADEVWRVLKIGCRYDVSYFYYSSGDWLLSRDGIAISGARLIDCPPKAPESPMPSARELMERMIRPQ